MNSISFFKALLMKELDQNKSSSEFEIPVDVKIAYKLWKDPNFPPGKLYSFSSGMKNPKDILNRFASELQNSGLIKVSAAGHPYVDALRWLDDNNEKLNEKDLPGNQEKIAQAAEPKDKITAADFAALRAKKDVKEEDFKLEEKVDMEELEMMLKKLKKDNPGKKVTYSFIKDSPKGYVFYIDKKLVKEGEDNDSGGGTLKIEKQGDKYYWTWNPKSGKSQKSDDGFESKADAQRDFMRQSKYMKESEGQDHEVSMAQNSLKSIISSASQLMNMLGQDEKDIPAWIQDHITNAENFINQASKNYHEYHNGEHNMDELPVGNEEEPVDDMTLQGLMETILSEYEVHYYMDGGKCYKKDDEGNKQEVNASECKRRGIREAKKPSAGLSKKQKSAIVKKAKSGKDMGKKGKGFEKIVKAAKKSGADNPEAVAGAAFWKGQAKKAK